MSDQTSADFSPLVSRSAASEHFRDALRLFVGRGRRYSVKQLANGSGVHPRMIESYMAPVDSQEWRRPHLEDVLSLASFLGPAFSSEWLRLANQGAFELPDEDPEPGELVAEDAQDHAEVTRRAIDGTFCEEDRAVLPVVGTRMMARGAKLIALRGGKAA
jgi:hypothetical protein